MDYEPCVTFTPQQQCVGWFFRGNTGRLEINGFRIVSVWFYMAKDMLEGGLFGRYVEKDM